MIHLKKLFKFLIYLKKVILYCEISSLWNAIKFILYNIYYIFILHYIYLYILNYIKSLIFFFLLLFLLYKKEKWLKLNGY